MVGHLGWAAWLAAQNSVRRVGSGGGSSGGRSPEGRSMLSVKKLDRESRNVNCAKRDIRLIFSALDSMENAY